MRIRWEEFILVSGWDRDKLSVFMVECLKEFWKVKHSDLKWGTFEVTFSAGISSFERSLTYDTLINQADLALYSAKNNWRNNIALYDESMKS